MRFWTYTDKCFCSPTGACTKFEYGNSAVGVYLKKAPGMHGVSIADGTALSPKAICDKANASIAKVEYLVAIQSPVLFSAAGVNGILRHNLRRVYDDIPECHHSNLTYLIDVIEGLQNGTLVIQQRNTEDKTYE